MSYQALYRVWRPRKFEDIVGQQHVTRTLQNAISQNKFSHAYLFSGPRGTGKTSAAKIFAQTINCEKMPTKEPCNECEACLGILDGSISDVIEMDAASNTSVDDIREIRDKVKYAPSAVPYKVYIIDEVHMISTNAFNALLKTLEEPPSHVVFILATTEPHKIPLTIISRCQRFDFKAIGTKAMVERMQTIIEAENIEVSKQALEAIALVAEGGMRDALSILDQAISFSDGTVELDDVLAVTGSVSQHVLTDMVTALYEQQVEQSIVLLDEILQNGKDPGRFVYDLIYFLRDILLYKSAPSLEDTLERSIIDEGFQQLSETLTVDWIQETIVNLTKYQQELKWTNSPKILIELALITIAKRYGSQEQTSDSISSQQLSQLTSRLHQLEKELLSLKQEPTPVQSQQRVKKTSTRTRTNSYRIPFEQIRHVLDEAKKQPLQLVKQEWVAFLSKLKDINAPAHATIQDSKPVAASESALIVAFKYEIHCSLFLDHQQTVENILGEVINQQLTIIPIPEPDWHDLRQDYLSNQEQRTSNQQTETDPIIEEARKLVGDELLQILE